MRHALQSTTGPAIRGARLNLRSLIERPNVRTPGEDERFWPVLQEAIDTTTARGNLVPDAHIAALMRTHGVRTIISHDRDFRKFPGIDVLDPFTG